MTCFVGPTTRPKTTTMEKRVKLTLKLLRVLKAIKSTKQVYGALPTRSSSIQASQQPLRSRTTALADTYRFAVDAKSAWRHESRRATRASHGATRCMCLRHRLLLHMQRRSAHPTARSYRAPQEVDVKILIAKDTCGGDAFFHVIPQKGTDKAHYSVDAMVKDIS